MSPARSGAPGLARYAAPAAFLLGVTIAVLLIRAGLGGGSPATTGVGPVTHPGPVSTAGTTAATTALTFTAPATTAVAGPQYYTVRSGDTFGAIAAREGVSVTQIEQLNPGVSSNALRVGQRLRVK